MGWARLCSARTDSVGLVSTGFGPTGFFWGQLEWAGLASSVFCWAKLGLAGFAFAGLDSAELGLAGLVG